MDKRLLVLCLIAYVTLLIGCSGGQVAVNADYKTGTGALTLSFDSNYPPSTLMENEQNTVVVTAKNTGGYTIENGKLLLTTDDSVFYLGTQTQFRAGARQVATSNLVTGAGHPFYGKSVMSPNGDTKAYPFDIYAITLPQESQKRSAVISAFACFPYETFQHAFVCIDFDPYKTTTSTLVKPACVTQDVTAPAGGGPVNVGLIQTRIDKDNSGDLLPGFYFTINAPSDLKFFVLGDQDAFCNGNQITATTHDTIYLSASLSDKPLNCPDVKPVDGIPNTYVVPMINNNAKIRCVVSEPILTNQGQVQGNYMAPLTINMTYGVVATASRTLTVTAQP